MPYCAQKFCCASLRSCVGVVVNKYLSRSKSGGLKGPSGNGPGGTGDDFAEPHTKLRQLKPSYRMLEQRIAFDAAAVATVAAVTAEDQSDQSGALTTDHGAASPATAHTNDLVDAITDAPVDVGAGTAPQTAIVFIDSSVENASALLSGVEPSAEIYVIDSTRGGLEQIASVLAGRTDIGAIYIISHGDAGRLFLGNEMLTSDNISMQADKLAAIGSSLSAEGDILIYGCAVGAGAKGFEFVRDFSSLTGADIAASTDDTGAAELGGDWDLEVQHGAVEARIIAAHTWDGLLAPISITNVTGTASVAGTALANNIAGTGITVTAATFTGDNTQAGTFTSATGYSPEWLGFSSGILLSTGNTGQVLGPNTAGGSSVDAPGGYTDADLGTLAGGTSLDAATVTISFIPTTDRITLKFTFGSEEYNEYVYSAYNDALGVFVNGVQAAVLPNGDTITINSVNQAAAFNPGSGNLNNDPNPTNGIWDSANPSLYISNPNSATGGPYNTGMDGFTVTISVVATVNPGVVNTIKIGITDIQDSQFRFVSFHKRRQFSGRDNSEHRHCNDAAQYLCGHRCTRE